MNKMLSLQDILSVDFKSCIDVCHICPSKIETINFSI